MASPKRLWAERESQKSKRNRQKSKVQVTSTLPFDFALHIFPLAIPTPPPLSTVYCLPSTALLRPDSRNHRVAELALTVVEINAGDRVAGAVHHFFAVMRAVGALRRVPGHVADVHVVESLGVGNGLGALQRLNGRGRQVLEQILGMEARKVQGH